MNNCNSSLLSVTLCDSNYEGGTVHIYNHLNPALDKYFNAISLIEECSTNWNQYKKKYPVCYSPVWLFGETCIKWMSLGIPVTNY